MVEQHILERLMRRLAARGQDDSPVAPPTRGCPDESPPRQIGRVQQSHRGTGASPARRGQAASTTDNPPLALRVRLGDEVALGQALGVTDEQTGKERIELIRAAGDFDLSRLKATLLGLFNRNRMPGL